MPKYANYDHTLATPQLVTGWYDTDTFTYASLPDFRDLLQITQAQWDARGTDFTNWAVDDTGTLIAYTPPPPLPVQAATLLAQNLALGIAVTSGSLPVINATYALDAVSTAQVFQIGTFANSFGVFPSGGTVQPYPDILGAPHTFSVPVFVAFLRAVAGLVSALQTQAGIMSNGGTPAWPSQVVDII
jgi:hypothetical protein